MRVTVAIAMLGLTVATVSACTSSGGSKTKPAAPSTTASSAPSTSSSAPSPTASSSPPQSPFESDPAMIVLRQWLAQVAKDFNAGQTFTDPALLKLETPTFAPTVTTQFSDDTAAGVHYPGPSPFQPLAISNPAPTVRVISGCAVGKGFAVDPKTNLPAEPLSVSPVDVTMDLSDGTWVVASIYLSSKVSCTTTKVPTPTW